MRLEWIPEGRDVDAIRAVVEEYADDHLVQDRWDRCIHGSRRPQKDRATRWMAMVACLLTTQQRSGPTSPINTFLRRDPNPLTLEKMRRASDPQSHAVSQLSGHSGIRWYNRIAKQLVQNLRYLEKDGWTALEDQLGRLPAPDSPEVERHVARWIAAQLAGFGPKQSRNLLQVLGLSRWEVPLDSRVLKWLRRLDIPFPLNAQLLSNVEYYEFASDAFQTLCRAAELPPAIVDAAIFASYDGGRWNEETLVW